MTNAAARAPFGVSALARCALFALFALLLITTRLGAQLPASPVSLASQDGDTTRARQAQVSGAVRDATSGAPLVGATVALTDVERVTVTDADGRYTLRDVAPGPQHLTVRRIGYAPRTLHALVPPGGRLEINVSVLPVPQRLQTLVVRAPAAAPGVEVGDGRAFPDRAMSIAAVRNHPVLAEPDAFQALGGGEVVIEPESPSGVHVRGGASDQTVYLLDGIPIFNPYHTAGLFSALNPDAVAGLRLSTPALDHPHALAGSIAADTREPGTQLRAQGALTSTQARLTVDGPVGATGIGYLASLRSGLPAAFARGREASYVQGEAADWLGKLEAPALGGRLRLLGYASADEITTAATTQEQVSAPRTPSRSTLEWQSRSVGAEWSGALRGAHVRLSGWSAASGTEAGWRSTDTSRVGLSAARRDVGLLATAQRGERGAGTSAGLRLERSRTTYRTRDGARAAASREIGGDTPLASLFVQHERPVSDAIGVTLGSSMTAADGGLHAGPRGEVRWLPAPAITLTGGYARLHQFAQSLRNGESIVRNVFPVDLHVGAGAPGVPVARSHQGVVAASWDPAPGLHVGVQGYARHSRGLLLVAPRTEGPFSSGDFGVGVGRARGVSADAALHGARWGVLARYGLQRVRITDGPLTYVPEHGTTQTLDGGVTLFPSATSAVRLGASLAFGRRGTPVSGAFEWEACNVLDRGCEFGGTPRADAAALGQSELPAYLRVDLSLRKHLHVSMGGRDVVVAMFGTVTNILNRRNVLTYPTQTGGGDPVPIEMRSRTPLVVGLEWRL